MLGYMVLFMSFTVLMGQHPLPELVLSINYWIIIDPLRIILKCLAKKLLEAAFFFLPDYSVSFTGIKPQMMYIALKNFF